MENIEETLDVAVVERGVGAHHDFDQIRRGWIIAAANTLGG